MQKTVNKVTIGGEKLNYYDKLVKTKPLTITTTDKAVFDKELLTAAWAEAFDRLGMNFTYKPVFRAKDKIFRPDFYLKDLDVFVVIKTEVDNGRVFHQTPPQASWHKVPKPHSLRRTWKRQVDNLQGIPLSVLFDGRRSAYQQNDGLYFFEQISLF
ncbi:hypothetical protein EOM82_09060 [bacterium]|nr:hypothetical protein [bacterium]